MIDRCPFCHIDPDLIREYGSVLWFCIRDSYPVNEGHRLIVLARHEPDLFEIGRDEWDDLWSILLRVRSEVARETGCTNFNIGINMGGAAGQTVPHLHVHVIPRYDGDCDDPRGGVRKVKPPLVDYP